MPGVQKVVDALDRALQSVETQMDDSKDDVVECDQQRELWEIFSNHSGYTATKHQDEHDDDEEEEEKDLVVPVVPVHMKGSLQLRGAIPARVVLFRKSIRSIIAEVLQVNTMQVHVNVNEPTTEGGNAYSVDIKFGTREEALHDATVIRRSNHNETNNQCPGKGLEVKALLLKRACHSTGRRATAPEMHGISWVRTGMLVLGV